MVAAAAKGWVVVAGTDWAAAVVMGWVVAAVGLGWEAAMGSDWAAEVERGLAEEVVMGSEAEVSSTGRGQYCFQRTLSD